MNDIDTARESWDDVCRCRHCHEPFRLIEMRLGPMVYVGHDEAEEESNSGERFRPFPFKFTFLCPHCGKPLTEEDERLLNEAEEAESEEEGEGNGQDEA